jgi:hypothetical protein
MGGESQLSPDKRLAYLIELLEGAMKVEADMNAIERRVDFSSIGPVAEAKLDRLQDDLSIQFRAISTEATKFGHDGMALVGARQQGRKQLYQVLGLLPPPPEART